jgi:hypothetical protein
MSGKLYAESPGWHTHNIEGPGGVGNEAETQYVMRSNPGDVPGVSNTVGTFPVIALKGQGSGATSDFFAKIAKLGTTSYDSLSTYYSEIRPAHVAFQVGIRY